MNENAMHRDNDGQNRSDSSGLDSDNNPVEVYSSEDESVADDVYVNSCFPLVTFRGHRSRIYSCALHPNEPWAATCSCRYHVYIWNLRTWEVLYEAEHRARVGPSLIRFSDDGTYLATAHRYGKLFVYKITPTEERTNMFELILQRTLRDLSWFCWYHNANILLVSARGGNIFIFSIFVGAWKTLRGPSSRCCYGELTNDNRIMFASYHNGSHRLWKLNTFTFLEFECSHRMGHIIACTNQLFVSGCIDGGLIFSDINGLQTRKTAYGGVSFLSFSKSDNHKFLACASHYGTLSIWDYEGSYQVLGAYNIGTDITCIEWIGEIEIAATSFRGQIIIFDSRWCIPKYRINAHMRTINQITYNPLNRLALTVSNDKRAKIWTMAQYI